MGRVLLEYLVNSLWQVPVIAAAAWFAARVMRASVRVQHGMWIAALLAAVAMPVVSIRQVASGPAAETAPLERVAAANGVVNAAPSLQPSRMHTWRDLLVWPGVREWRLTDRATRWIVRVYMGVIAFCVGRLLVSVEGARRVVRDATTARLGEAEGAMLRRCCEALEMECPEVRESAEVWSPMVIGVRRPVLIVPAGFIESDESSSAEAVWWHELAHVRRQDFAANLVCRIWALPILYHPAAQFIAGKIRRTREMVCDAVAAERMGSPVEYARQLVEIAERMDPEMRIEAGAIGMFGGGALEERVMELVAAKGKASMRARMVRMAVSVTSTVTVVAGTALFHVKPTMADSRADFSVAAVRVIEPVQSAAFAGVIAPERMKTVLAVYAPQEAKDAAAAPQETRGASAPDGHTQVEERIARAQARADEAVKKLNDEDVQKKIEKALEKVNSPEFQKKIQDAVAQSKEVNAAEIQSRVQEAMAKAQAKIDSPEFKKRMEELNSPEFRERMEEQAKRSAEVQLKSEEMQKRMAELQTHMEEMQKHLQEQLNSPEFRKQMKQIDSPEFKEQMKQMQKDVEKMTKEWDKDKHVEKPAGVKPQSGVGVRPGHVEVTI